MGDFLDEVRSFHRCGVPRHLGCPFAKGAIDILNTADSPAHCERDEHLLSGTPNHVKRGGSVPTAGGDVEEREFVCTFAVVPMCQLDGVASITQVGEVDALHDTSGVDVKTR